MTELLVSMLPLYLIGNLHCAGMCGPLVMMLGRHPYRHLYFIGRIASFSLAAAAAGAFGSLIHLQFSGLMSVTSLALGVLLMGIGILRLAAIPLPAGAFFARQTAGVSQSLSLLLLQERPFAAFLFGFCTVLLPCGQTLIVFSACALAGDGMVGLINGFAFALLTTPALFFSMRFLTYLTRLRPHYHTLFGTALLLTGCLALLRGLADLQLIPHLILIRSWHLMLY